MLRFIPLVLVAWLAVGYLLHTLQSLVQDAPFANLPALALVVGGYVDRVLDGKSRRWLRCSSTGLFALFVARDFFNFGPEQVSVGPARRDAALASRPTGHRSADWSADRNSGHARNCGGGAVCLGLYLGR